MDNNEVRKTLQQIGFDEVHLITNYVCYRDTEKGIQQVFVELKDLGSEPARYKCSAKTEDGKRVAGNSSSSLARAIMNVPWKDLDR